MERFAHSVEGQPEANWEPLAHHLADVGRGAAERAGWFGASTIALAMGLLHDIGKTALAYQRYIRRPADKTGPKGPDHSSAGAIEAVGLYGKRLGRIMAFGIAGHHAGLMDGSGHEGGSLSVRLQKQVEDYSGWRAHVPDLPTVEAIGAGLPKIEDNVIEPGFSRAFLTRMLASCLVDADFLETEAFYARARGEAPPERGGVLTPEHVGRVSDYMARHRRNDTPVNRLRSDILDHVMTKTSLPPGLFTLTVPTGGGKTLTSLNFAMQHAATHGLRRIVYVIPFTSIIEQTAQIFREDENVGLGDAVLEHRGGVGRNATSSAGRAGEVVASRAGAWVETWSVLTTSAPTMVASRAGAWVETWSQSWPVAGILSPPAPGSDNRSPAIMELVQTFRPTPQRRKATVEPLLRA